MRRLRFAALAAALLAFPLTAAAASSPAPIPTPKLPATALHVDLQVEVNKLGQVVRVLHGNLSGDRAFDTMTIGNALQMWIRDQQGSTITAVPGLYRLNYDYNPSTHSVHRGVTLLSRGGKWVNESGAATLMAAEAQREARDAYARLQAEKQKKLEEQSKNLPDINGIVKKSVVKPTATPSPKP